MLKKKKDEFQGTSRGKLWKIWLDNSGKEGAHNPRKQNEIIYDTWWEA
jgi:hypothetical protein